MSVIVETYFCEKSHQKKKRIVTTNIAPATIVEETKVDAPIEEVVVAHAAEEAVVDVVAKPKKAKKVKE